MKTPKEYSEHLSKNEITYSMLSEALFSVNKRAKNYRDAKRKVGYRSKYYEGNELKEQQFYNKKEMLLSVLQPRCIHKELLKYKTVRHYNTGKNFEDEYFRSLFYGTLVFYRPGRFCDDYCEYETDYFDEILPNQPVYNYYLYYVIGNHTFHTPIKEDEIQNYDLPIVEIGKLETRGFESTELISVQFVDKIIDLIKTKEYKLLKDIEDNEPLYDNHIESFEPVPNYREAFAIFIDRIKRRQLNVPVNYRDIDVNNLKLTTKTKKNKCKQKVKHKYKNNLDGLLDEDKIFDFMVKEYPKTNKLSKLVEKFYQDNICNDYINAKKKHAEYEKICNVFNREIRDSGKRIKGISELNTYNKLVTQNLSV